MAWIGAIIVSSRSTSVTCVTTSSTPSPTTTRLNLSNSSYGGYTKNTTYEPTVVLWQQGADSGSFTVNSVQGYSVEWYSTQRDYGRLETISASDYSLYLGSGNTISIPSVEAAAHRKVYGSGFYDNYLVYSKYVANTYVVIFDPQGGSISDITEYWKYVTFGRPYGTLPTPTRTGYTFSGWYTSASGGTRVTQNTTVSTPNDHTLYAHWTSVSVQYTLYFNANGGTVSEPSRQVTEGSAYGTLPVPTWTNYSFVGWFTDMYGGTQVSASTTMGNDDTTVYAHWTRNMITVPFDGNGGTPDVPSAEYPAGSVYGILPSATRSGYIFTGWYNYATGGTQVPPSATVTSQILYAHWQEQGDPVDGVIWNSNNIDCILENS